MNLSRDFFFWGGGIQQQPKTPLKIMDSTDLGGGGSASRAPSPEYASESDLEFNQK